MNWAIFIPLIIAVAFVIGIVVASVLWRREVSRSSDKQDIEAAGGKYPFERVDGILDESERPVMHTLVREIGEDLQVFPKVALSRIAQPSPKAERRDFYMRLVSTRYVDLLVCSARDLRPLVAIQLIGNHSDDHEITAAILESAGIRFIHLPLKKAQSPGELSYMIRNALRHHRRPGVGSA